MRKIVFASNNGNKIQEVQHQLKEQYKLLSLADINCTEELSETSDTLRGNALQKAQYVAENYGVDCFADDTGLLVDALNGEPGVYSARYAGAHRSNEDNMSLVLDKLGDSHHRSARFVTVICLIIDGQTHYFEGEVRGNITLKKSGEKGFGYDPIFRPEGFDRTFAEFTVVEKNKISHRGKAVDKLISFLQNM